MSYGSNFLCLVKLQSLPFNLYFPVPFWALFLFKHSYLFFSWISIEFVCAPEILKNKSQNFLWSLLAAIKIGKRDAIFQKLLSFPEISNFPKKSKNRFFKKFSYFTHMIWVVPGPAWGCCFTPIKVCSSLTKSLTKSRKTASKSAKIHKVSKGAPYKKCQKKSQKIDFSKSSQTFHTWYGLFRDRLGDVVSPL